MKLENIDKALDALRDLSDVKRNIEELAKINDIRGIENFAGYIGLKLSLPAIDKVKHDLLIQLKERKKSAEKLIQELE